MDGLDDLRVHLSPSLRAFGGVAAKSLRASGAAFDGVFAGEPLGRDVGPGAPALDLGAHASRVLGRGEAVAVRCGLP